MKISRRTAMASLMAVPAALRSPVWASSPGRLMVVTTAAAGPQMVAAESLRQSLSERSVGTTTYQLPAEDSAFRLELKNSTNQLAIALGIDALRSLAAGKAQSPLLTTMSFRADLKSSGVMDMPDFRLAGAVWLDLAISQIVTGLRLVFPDASRIAVIRNPTQPEAPDLTGQAHSQAAGANIRIVDCAGPADLLPALRKLRGQVEMVICLPDSSLYNKTTVEPLILASLEHRLPLVGFSSSFVRAGAAVGVYPDFADIGRQTAALALRSLAGATAFREEFPRRTAVSANERVLHLLGRDFNGQGRADVQVVR